MGTLDFSGNPPFWDLIHQNVHKLVRPSQFYQVENRFCNQLYSNIIQHGLQKDVIICQVQCSVVQWSTVQYSTVLYCTVLYCTVLYCTVPVLCSHSLECSHQSGYPGWLHWARAAKKAAAAAKKAAVAKKAGRIILICSVLYMLPQWTPAVDWALLPACQPL